MTNLQQAEAAEAAAVAGHLRSSRRVADLMAMLVEARKRENAAALAHVEAVEALIAATRAAHVANQETVTAARLAVAAGRGDASA